MSKSRSIRRRSARIDYAVDIMHATGRGIPEASRMGITLAGNTGSGLRTKALKAIERYAAETGRAVRKGQQYVHAVLLSGLQAKGSDKVDP